MTDNEICKVLEDFANSHTLAKDINVTITNYSTLLEPKEGIDAFKYEDGQMLQELIRGAKSLLLWARREGKVRYRTIKAVSEKTLKNAKTETGKTTRKWSETVKK